MADIRFACFDLFDTVLLRRVLQPDHVFRLTYKSLRAQAERTGTLSYSEDAFVSARIVAERRARIGEEETTLEDVWKILAPSIEQIDLRAGIAAELAAERETIYANKEILELINVWRKKGAMIVFISDMYLEDSFLKSLLVDLDIFRPEDRLFVSSSYKKTKHSGALYRAVMEETGGAPAEHWMVGDNRRSDVLMARKCGWKARHYRGHKLSSYETRLYNRLNCRSILKSTIVGSVRAVRKGQTQQPVGRLVGDVLGIGAMMWALWAIRMAERDGLSRLYFMSRDAHLPWICARALQEAGLTKVDCRYFHGSRYVYYFSNIAKKASELDWIFSQTKKLNWPKLLRYLRLEEQNLSADVRSFLNAFDREKNLTKVDFDELIAVISNSGDIKAVQRSAADMRRLATGFLRQEGVLYDDRFAFVDIGWHLNVQSEIWKLMPEQRVKGYYVYLSADRVPPVQAGDATAMIEMVSADSRRRNIPQIWHVSTVAEHLFGITLEGTCVGYEEKDGRISPVLMPIDPSSAERKARLIDDVRIFAEEAGPMFAALFEDAENCGDVFSSLMDVFLETPTREAIQDLQSTVEISSDTQNDDKRPLVMPVGLADIGKLVAIAAGKDRHGRFDWLAGTLAISPFPLSYGKFVLRAVRKMF